MLSIRPVCICDVASAPDADAFVSWLRRHAIRTLNVAGPRESESPGVYAFARGYLFAILT